MNSFPTYYTHSSNLNKELRRDHAFKGAYQATKDSSIESEFRYSRSVANKNIEKPIPDMQFTGSRIDTKSEIQKPIYETNFELEELTKEIKKIQKSISQNFSKFENLTTLSTNVEKIITSLDQSKKIESLNNDNFTLQNQNQSLQNKNQSLNSQCQNLKAENIDLQKGNAEMKAQFVKFSRFIKAKNSENKNLKNENEKLKVENEKLKDENEKLKDENGKLKGENELFQEKYISVQQENENLTKNISEKMEQIPSSIENILNAHLKKMHTDNKINSEIDKYLILLRSIYSVLHPNNQKTVISDYDQIPKEVKTLQNNLNAFHQFSKDQKRIILSLKGQLCEAKNEISKVKKEIKYQTTNIIQELREKMSYLSKNFANQVKQLQDENKSTSERLQFEIQNNNNQEFAKIEEELKYKLRDQTSKLNERQKQLDNALIEKSEIQELLNKHAFMIKGETEQQFQRMRYFHQMELQALSNQ
ncbi:hypothetical protein TRFO_25504 [Tritrichomonas foetus]|uniref:Uncharacterized protein n=1 Tax=Tritrichomonas foetus TaxID=1144522 RepID=A0A1J4K9V5_9EUKA|nr:hypothetical protein TRFO_25504 [Tritrichomonas foetus]|eukprot:OHT06476.1 hypothetical protein TRFO_25504 [Tritrichomonas foetus]